MRNTFPNSALIIAYVASVIVSGNVESIEQTENEDSNSNKKAASILLHEEIKDYLRTKPLSPDLRSFIQRSKRRNKFVKRMKRSHDKALDENNFFIYDNGHVVPFKSMKTNFDKRREDEFGEYSDNSSCNDNNAYTVVPLIIPIHQKPLNIKTRTLSEDLINSIEKAVFEKRNMPSSSQSPLETSPAALIVSSIATLGDGIKEEQPSDSGGESGGKPLENDEDSHVLHKILEDVEGLMQWKTEGNKREGVICNINGSWDSEAAGMRFDICYRNETRKKFRINLADRVPPNDDGFFCDGNWTVFGELPFQHSGVVIVLAVHPKDKHIATFIGECRTCEGSETVSGAWLVSRSSRDCKDQKATAKIFSDVWRREQVHNLRKKHLLEMGYTEDSSST